MANIPTLSKHMLKLLVYHWKNTQHGNAYKRGNAYKQIMLRNMASCQQNKKSMTHSYVIEKMHL